MSVTPSRSAASIARSDGAETAAMIGTPATAAFWTISKLTRPLTMTIRSWSGICFARTCDPTSLSSALCRPTSSRSARSSPFGVNSPDAWRPPVSSNAFWAARSRSGRASSTRRSTIGPSGMGSERTATSSSEALPQIPQDAVATKCRSGTTLASNGRARRTVIRSSGWFISLGSPVSNRRISGPSIRPSVFRKPAASSSSKPGVRIVIATATGSWPGPAARISSGSSPTTRSPRNSRWAPRTATIRVVVTWRVGGGVASVTGLTLELGTTPAPS